MKNIKIGNRIIGDGNPVFIVAEIGSNHNQDYDLALEHIEKAADAGVDAVKFQTFKANKHVSKYAEMPSYLNESQTIHELIESLELNRSWQKNLKSYSESKGLVFFSSPCDYDAVDSLEKINVDAHKVASFDLPDLDLIRYISKTLKPIILSTGMADINEIKRAIDVSIKEKNDKIIVLHCTSIYPAPTELSNLKAMLQIKDTFDVIVGYSDHTIGDTIAIAAVSMGALMIEKHFTVNKKLPGPDHSFAIEPNELRIMVDKIREIEAAFGDGEKNGPRNEELEMYKKVRRSIHARKNIKSGEIIKEDMLEIKRPGYGIEPYKKNEIIGKKVKENILADHWITEDMIE